MTERNRTRNLDSASIPWNFSVNVYAADCDEQSWDSTPYSGTYVEKAHHESFTDIVTKNFASFSQNGGIVNSPMTQVITITRDALNNFNKAYGWRNKRCDPEKWVTYEDWTAGSKPSSYTIDWEDLPTIPEFDPGSLIDVAVNKAYASIDETDIQSLVVLGELDKTVVSMASIFRRLIKVIKKAKRLDLRYLRKELSMKELSQRYMELRYALRPLVYDAAGLCTALGLTGEKPRRTTFRGFENYEDSDSTLSVDNIVYRTNVMGEWTHENHWTKKWEHSIFVRAGVLTELDEKSSLNIWGLTQPIESGWELVPFSFIIDWFFNVGDTIAAWTPNYGIRSLASWYTIEDIKYQYVKLEHKNAEKPSGTSEWEPLTYERDLGNCILEKTVITKTRVPNPRRTILPTFSMSVDWLKLTDLLIIAKQLFFGRK